MTAQPRASVLMPVLSPEPRLLREAIDSVRAQTMTDWELVIVEDPSPRTGQAVVESYRDPRIRYHLNPERTSLCRQRNRTLELARAEYVAMLDADDVAMPGRLERQVRFLDDHPEVGVVGSWIEAMDVRGRPLGVRRYPTGHDEIHAAMRRYNPIAQPSVMARRSVILGAGGYQYDLHPAVEDYDLWCRLAKAGVKFANLPRPLLRYRIHSSGSKSSKLHLILQGTMNVKKTHWGREMGLVDQARLACERALMFLPASWVLRLFLAMSYSR